MKSIKKTLKPRQKYFTKGKRLIFVKQFEDFKGKLPKNPSIIRDRLNPRLCDFSYLMTRSFRRTMADFVNLTNKKKGPLTILDLGCGYEPFKKLFPKNSNYIGVDMSLNSYADIIADNHQLPFKNNTFDIVIASEVLEHSSNEYQFIEELTRVSKNKALVFISLPFIFPEHGQPYDFQRLTKYKLKELFKNHKIISLKESNNIVSSVFVFINLFFRIILGSSGLLSPIYIFNNLLALAAEKIKPPNNAYLETALKSCPIGYSLIVEIKK